MIQLVTIMVRKPMNYEQLLHDQLEMASQFHTHPEKIKITTILEISHEEFIDFKNNLLAERNFTQEHDDIFLVKEKGANNYDGLIIDAQGFPYARYVGIPMKEIEYKKCPRCHHYYIGHHALSRKDNKTEICPTCFVEESLEALGYYKDFEEFLTMAHQIANKYHSQITITKSNHKKIIVIADE